MSWILEFFSNEFCFEKVTWFSFVLYAVYGIIIVDLVRITGPVSIREYLVETAYDENENSITNVVYRIFSPVIISYIFVLSANMVSQLAGAPPLQMKWLPIACYWTRLGWMKYRQKEYQVLPLWAFVLEALVSSMVGIMFDWCVVYRLPEMGITALDQSGIGFQILTFFFFAIAQMIVSSVMRRKYRVQMSAGPVVQSDQRNASAREEYGSYRTALVDTSEMKLFEYERLYGGALPKRYQSDPVLRAVFFSIMAIEDANRPAATRTIERIMCTFGLAKTTGIMQQKSDTPLSDNESVLIAADYIVRMWDNYLVNYARSAGVAGRPDVFQFGRTWYQYRYADLAAMVRKSFSLLYGDYCGTRQLRADYVFCDVLDFEERNCYGLLPDLVCAEGSLFEIEASWFSDQPLYWSNGLTVSAVKTRHDEGEACRYRKGHGVNAADIAALADKLGFYGVELQEVSFADGLWCKVCVSEDDNLDMLEVLAALDWRR